MNKRFNAEQIAENLADEYAGRLHSLQVLPQVDSTNSFLLAESPPAEGRFRVVLAEHQTKGRGQFGNVWESPPHSGICLSLAYTFETQACLQPSLSLAIGTAVAHGLSGLGVQQIAVKWPNDIIAMHGKLGGILVESRVAGTDHQSIVAGVGLNQDVGGALDHLLPAGSVGRISDLKQCAATDIAPAEVAVTLINSLVSSVLQYQRLGFPSFLERYRNYDWLFGRAINIDASGWHIRGTASGVDSDGALLVQTEHGVVPVISGKVTLALPHGVVA